MLDSMYAKFSSALPLEWTSSTAEIDVIDAVPFMADSVLENGSELQGKIALVSRGAGVTFSDKAKRASEAGAIGVIIVNTEDVLMKVNGEAGYKSSIPVLMIKPSDAARLREHGGALLRDRGTPPPLPSLVRGQCGRCRCAMRSCRVVPWRQLDNCTNAAQFVSGD